jgi:hypothetical protein
LPYMFPIRGADRRITVTVNKLVPFQWPIVATHDSRGKPVSLSAPLYRSKLMLIVSYVRSGALATRPLHFDCNE